MKRLSYRERNVKIPVPGVGCRFERATTAPRSARESLLFGKKVFLKTRARGSRPRKARTISLQGGLNALDVYETQARLERRVPWSAAFEPEHISLSLSLSLYRESFVRKGKAFVREDVRFSHSLRALWVSGALKRAAFSLPSAEDGVLHFRKGFACKAVRKGD